MQNAANAPKALKVALLHSLFLLCFANGLMFPFDRWMYPVAISIPAVWAAAALSIGFGLVLSLATIWLFLAPEIVANGEIVLYATYFTFAALGAYAVQRSDETKGATKALALSIALLLAAVNILYRFPYRLAFALVLTIIGGASFAVSALGLKWFGNNRAVRALIAIVGLTIPVSWTALFGQAMSVPVPLESAIAGLQKDVEVVMPAGELPSGVRTAAPAERGWLAVLVKPTRESLYWLALLDANDDRETRPIPPERTDRKPHNYRLNTREAPNALNRSPASSKQHYAIAPATKVRLHSQTIPAFSHNKFSRLSKDIFKVDIDINNAYNIASDGNLLFEVLDLDSSMIQPDINIKSRYIVMSYLLLLYPFSVGIILPFDGLIYPLLASVPLVWFLSKIAPGISLVVIFILLWPPQSLAILVHGEPALYITFLFLITAGIYLIVNSRPKRLFRNLQICFSVIFFSSIALHYFPCIIYMLASAIIILASYFVAATILSWLGTAKIARICLGLVCLSIPISRMALLDQSFSTPAILDSFIANHQRDVETVIPSYSLPTAPRLAAKWNGYFLALAAEPLNETLYGLELTNDKGEPLTSALPVKDRIDYIRKRDDDTWLIPGLLGRKLGAIDVSSWRITALSELTEPNYRVFLSPSRKLAATNNSDDTTPIHIFRTDDLQLIAKVDLRFPNGKLCESGAIAFASDELMFATCNGGYLYSVRIAPDGAIDVSEPLKLPHGMMTEAMQIFDENHLIMIDLYLGTVAILDVPSGRVVRKRFVAPLPRALKKVEALNMWCVASELGLVFLLDDELNIRKTFYCGAKIKDIYVDGKKLYTASQAGIVEADLEEMLWIGEEGEERRRGDHPTRKLTDR